MARIFKLLGRDIVIGKRLFGLGKDEGYWGEMTGFGTDLKSFARLDSYKGVVFACINLIAESVASYEPVIYQPKGDQWEALQDHPFLELLRRPGGVDDKAIPISQFDLLYATAAFIELQGEVYWYMAKGMKSGLPKEIVVLRTDKVGRELNKDTGDIERFFVRSTGGQKIYIEVDEMLPFVGFDPKDPYKSISPTQAAKEYIQTDEYATSFTKNFFRNNAGINGVLSVSGEVIKSAFKKFVRQWRAKYEGVDNAGKTAIIRDTEVNFTKVGLGLNELDMSALRKMSRDDIAMMYRVPLPLLGKGEETGLGRANVEALEYIFAKWTIEPKLKKLDNVLQFALERYYGATNLVLEHTSTIPLDKEFELSQRDKSVDRWRTRNELRDEDGLDPADGGDQLFAQVQQVPIDEMSLDPAPDDEPTEEEKSIKIIRRSVIAPTKKKDETPTEINIEHKENFRIRLMRNQVLYERRYKAKVRPILREQLKEALFNLEAKATSLTFYEVWQTRKDFNEKLFDDAAADKLFTDTLTPVLINLGEDQGALALLFAGDEEDTFRMTAPYEKYLRNSTKKMASNFNDETLARLNRTLAEGIQLGESLSKLKNRVESVYNMAAGSRSLRIARTETLKASNAATNEAYRQTGYVKGKQWYVNPDGCPICEEMDGKTVPLDDDFLQLGQSLTYTDEDGETQTYDIDYDTIETPPIHPNCRCTIVPVR